MGELSSYILGYSMMYTFTSKVTTQDLIPCYLLLTFSTLTSYYDLFRFFNPVCGLYFM